MVGGRIGARWYGNPGKAIMEFPLLESRSLRVALLPRDFETFVPLAERGSSQGLDIVKSGLQFIKLGPKIVLHELDMRRRPFLLDDNRWNIIQVHGQKCEGQTRSES